MSEFQAPNFSVGTQVRVAFDHAFTRPMLGWILVAKPTSPEIEVHDYAGRIYRYNGRLRNDPYLLDHPHFFGDPSNCVFEPTEEWHERQELKRRVEALEQLLASQAEAIAALQNARAPGRKMKADGESQ